MHDGHSCGGSTAAPLFGKRTFLLPPNPHPSLQEDTEGLTKLPGQVTQACPHPLRGPMGAREPSRLVVYIRKT